MSDKTNHNRLQFRQWKKDKTDCHIWGYSPHSEQKWFNPKEGEEWENPEDSEQFTGLYDKNGAKIWEGDIVKAKARTGREEYDIYGVVMWRARTACFFCHFGHSFRMDNGIVGTYEVIGNIHQNKDLL